MGSAKIYYKRNLPHYQPQGYSFFITFRLFGTLPADVVKGLKEIKQENLKQIAGYDKKVVRKEKYSELQNKYFKLYGDYLDKANSGSKWLKDLKIAGVVKNAFHFRDGKEYNLIAYTIMPNHVHLIFIPIVERDSSRSPNKHSIDINVDVQYPVTDILRKLKGSTARECNKLLNRTGSFWQHESYDHVIRDTEALKRIVDYVLNNPVKAGLIKTQEGWKHSYVNYNLIQEI
jgi:putative transposase